jgi:hypothetical protein
VKYRAYIIGIVAVVLAANVAQTTPAYSRVVDSARTFQRYYNDLKQGDKALNPVERFVFSLLLVNSRTPAQTTDHT